VRVPRSARRVAAAVPLLLTAALVPASPAAGEPDAPPQFLNVRIDSITPDVISTAAAPIVTIVATVTNVGDRPVRDVVARLERSAPVDASTGLRTAVDPAVNDYQAVGEFISVTNELDRGQAAGLTFAVPIGPGPPSSLGISTPGVYPLLINVNGTPDYGAPARLDEDRFLLPVTGVPPSASSGNPLTDTAAPDTTRPVAVTLLWPLADRPRLAPGVPGGTGPVRLMNDDLAVSLAPGGRLDTLLAAAEFATSPAAIDPAGGLDRALCLAVDADLLVTVNAMTLGYVVSDSPDGLGQAAHPGAGQSTASGWLDRLRGLARRMCVVATPYANADLAAVQRVSDRGLSDAATTNAADVVDTILGITCLRGATVLGDGPLTEDAAALLAAQGPTTVISAAAGGGELSARRLSPALAWLPFDPAVGGALAAVGTDPGVPAYLTDALRVPVDGDSPVARRQNAVAAALWRTLQPGLEPRTEVLVPPMKWSPQADDARALLSAVADAVRAGLATPLPLGTALADAAGAPAESDPQLPNDVAGRFDDDVTATIGAQLGRLGQLTPAMTTDPRTGVTGAQYTAPLREDMLRALSQNDPVEGRNEIARQRLAVVGGTIEAFFGAVTVVSPGDSYTLATERGALPLALRNDLAVPVRVRLQVDAPPGMTVTDVGEQELPPGYLPLRVPVELHVTQRVAVDVTLRTPDGVALGEPVRLSVHSNAYGRVLFGITLTGALILALLIGRRLYHRFRGQPDRADTDRPLIPQRERP